MSISKARHHKALTSNQAIPRYARDDVCFSLLPQGEGNPSPHQDDYIFSLLPQGEGVTQ